MIQRGLKACYNSRSPLLRGFSTTQTVSPDFKLTTLPNGIRVASDPVPGYFAAMGLYINAGSRYENVHLSGASHITDRLAFKSTKKRTAEEVQETLELLGGNHTCTSSRETIMYQASVFNSDVEAMFDVLSDTVKSPLITEQEVLSQCETARYENREIWQRPDLILPELVHVAAYKGGLGNPLLCPEERIAQITPDIIREYRRRYYRPENIVAGFVCVEHDRAVELVEKYLGDFAKEDISGLEKIDSSSKYVGSEISIPMNEPVGNLPEFTHLHVAFEGLPISDPDVYALATLQTLLGGGGSFSAGGPGKGMYSRLYTNVLNQYGYVESAQSFNHSYSDSGLFGISSSCIPQAAPYMAEILCQQFNAIMSTGRGALTYTEVSRAKNQLKSSLLMNLESKMVELEDMGRQIQIHGTKIPVQEMCEKIEALDVEDLRRVATRIFLGNASQDGSGKPTIVMQGDREIFGDIEKVFKHYGLGKDVKKSWW